MDIVIDVIMFCFVLYCIVLFCFVLYCFVLFLIFVASITSHYNELFAFALAV